MGDFNINLLNFETHTDTFMNTLGSYCFHPQILQPTRITDHSATLIDNIFINSLNISLSVVIYYVILLITFQIF